jgi:peroxiredoxin (alkyl hydroperoxide reductase subunit C)
MDCCLKRKIFSIGNSFPSFTMQAVVKDHEGDKIITVDNDYIAGKKAVFFFYPLDFTFVCPTELQQLMLMQEEFAKECTLITISTDSVYSHMAWKRENQSLAKISFPMASDLGGILSQKLGVLNNANICNRTTYIVDENGIIQYLEVFPSSVGRDPKAILRVLRAVGSQELCGACWLPGDDYITL